MLRHLRSGCTAEHAFYANQELRTAVSAVAAPRASGLRSSATAQANQIRGLLSEFGLVAPQGISHIVQRVPESIVDTAIADRAHPVFSSSAFSYSVHSNIGS